MTVDVAARLAQGRPAVANTEAYVDACRAVGYQNADLTSRGGQIGECFPDGGSDDVTLTVFTMGGNDISKITQLGGEASPDEVSARTRFIAALALA